MAREPSREVPAVVPSGLTLNAPSTVRAASRMWLTETTAGGATAGGPGGAGGPRPEKPPSKYFLPPPVMEPLLETEPKNTAVAPSLTRRVAPALLVRLL